MKPKVIALYLPQFHQIPENDEFWGEGFTDWVTVRKAQPLYEGHLQPKTPLSDNYYDLSLTETVRWQAQLAKENGIDGFGVYHYWFNNEKNLLTKPAEILRDEDIEMEYFFIWDNSSWKRSWSNVDGNAWAPVAESNAAKKGPEILIPYILGEEKDWENHYRYVSSHFKSANYTKVDNRPVFGIFRYNEDILKMCAYWDELAKEDGFDGVHFVFHNPRTNALPRNAFRYDYEPHASGWQRHLGFWGRVCRKLGLFQPVPKPISIYDYDELWHYLLRNAKKHSSSVLYHGAFVSYDDSPRRGRNGAIIVKGATPEKFEAYFRELLRISTAQKKDFIFLTAWNEWGEGAYLEPDSENEYQYLSAIKRAKQTIK